MSNFLASAAHPKPGIFAWFPCSLPYDLAPRCLTAVLLCRAAPVSVNHDRTPVIGFLSPPAIYAQVSCGTTPQYQAEVTALIQMNM